MSVTREARRLVKYLPGNTGSSYEPENYGPVLEVDEITDEVFWIEWIRGFESAMGLRPETWEQIKRNDEQDVTEAVEVIHTFVEDGGRVRVDGKLQVDSFSASSNLILSVYSAAHSGARQARFVGGVCAGLAVGSAAAGAEYDWQVAGSYGQDDAAGIVDSSRWTLGGSYYPKPVDDTRGPYELAPFLTRSSYVTVGLSRAREEMVSVGYIGGEPGFIERIIELYSRYTAETSEWSVAGRYVWRESGWFAGGGVERGGTEESPSSSATSASCGAVPGRWGRRYAQAGRTTAWCGRGSWTRREDRSSRIRPRKGCSQWRTGGCCIRMKRGCTTCPRSGSRRPRWACGSVS